MCNIMKVVSFLSKLKVNFKTKSHNTRISDTHNWAHTSKKCFFNVSMCLFGPLMFKWINIKVKTNDTGNCPIWPGLMPFKLTVPLVIEILDWLIRAQQ